MTIDEIKALILWCKSHKVRSFSQGDVKFELSDLAFIDEINQELTGKEMTYGGSNSLMDTLKPSSKEEDEELLYWSAK